MNDVKDSVFVVVISLFIIRDRIRFELKTF